MRKPAVILVALLVATTSCEYSAPIVVPAEGVVVKPQTVHLVAVGDTATLVATVAPLNATIRTVTWESTDSTVVTVDANGHLKAKKFGAGVFVTAFTVDGHFQASANITVGP